MYRIVPDADVLAQVAALPDDVLAAYAEVLEVLRLVPWDGRSQHDVNPDGAVRRWTFGERAAGQVVYLILEPELEVHLLLVQWWG